MKYMPVVVYCHGVIHHCVYMHLSLTFSFVRQLMSAAVAQLSVDLFS